MQYLGVALEGGQHARALRVRGAAEDEGPPEALRILAQSEDVVREHNDLVPAHLQLGIMNLPLTNLYMHIQGPVRICTAPFYQY